MENIGYLLIGLLIIILLSVVGFGLYRTGQMQKSDYQKEFLTGKTPSKPLDGFYRGTVRNLKTDWQGKTFDATASTGINIFKRKKGETKEFPFKTYIGKGLMDKDKDVFKIDYSNSTPFWVRLILDEIVEVSPNKFLGKVNMKIIPGLPFTVGFFRLEK